MDSKKTQDFNHYYSEHYLPFENKNLKSFAVFLAQQTLTKTSIDEPSVIIDVKNDILYFVELLHVCKQHHPIMKITRNRLLNSCNCTFLKQINWFSQNIAVQSIFHSTKYRNSSPKRLVCGLNFCNILTNKLKTDKIVAQTSHYCPPNNFTPRGTSSTTQSKKPC